MGESVVEIVYRSLENREVVIYLLKFYIIRAQQRIQVIANKHRPDRSFEVGPLKLQLYRQVLVTSRLFNKLAAKYYGHYMIEVKIGVAAHNLLLPIDVLIHPTFHDSQIKRWHTLPLSITHPYFIHLCSPYFPTPEIVLDKRLVHRGKWAVE